MKEFDDATEIMIEDGQELVLPDEQEAEEEVCCPECGSPDAKYQFDTDTGFDGYYCRQCCHEWST